MIIIEAYDVQVNLEANMANKFNADLEEYEVHKIKRQEKARDVLHIKLCVFLE
jgi:hypothetical protein